MRRPAATAALLLLCFVRGDEGRRRLRSPIYMQRHGSDAQAQLRTKGSASAMVQGSARPSELMLQDPTFFDRYYRGFSDRDAACTPRPAPQSPLRWHHIAKTGQSFVFTILRWGCPSISLRAVADLARQGNSTAHSIPLVRMAEKDLQLRKRCDQQRVMFPIAGHVPVQRCDPSRLVTMLRDPMQRLAARALIAKKDSARAGESSEMLTRRLRLLVAANRGCYVRVLTGQKCATTADTVTAQDIRRRLPYAIKAVRSFAFVGLVEQWHASICLFHAMISGELTLEREEIQNWHEAPSQELKEQGLYDVDTVLQEAFEASEESWLDDFRPEAEIYKAAQHQFRFNWQQNRHRLASMGSSCSRPFPIRQLGNSSVYAGRLRRN